MQIEVMIKEQKHQISAEVQCVPEKGFGSADIDTTYIHNNLSLCTLIRTLSDAHILVGTSTGTYRLVLP